MRNVTPVVLAALLLLVVSGTARADDKRWEPPKDGVLTEKQLDAWIDYTMKVSKLRTDLLKWIQNNKTDLAGATARSQEVEEQDKKLLKASGLHPDEVQWIATE